MVKGADGAWGIGASTGTAASPPPPAAPPAAAATQWRSNEQMQAEMASDSTAIIELQTSKGPIKIYVVPSWAPKGAEQFLKMVSNGFYDDISIYRAVSNGLLQFGALQGGDPRSGQYQKLADDPLCGIPYAEGVVGFAAAGPGTRKHTVCIMKADFRSQLGKGAIGTLSTETPFGMVAPESMAIMHSITCMGDIPQCGGKGPDPGLIEEQGNSYIRAQFPMCDFITGATRIK